MYNECTMMLIQCYTHVDSVYVDVQSEKKLDELK